MTKNLLDEVRDYWNSRPCNLRHSQSPIGTKEYFDEVEARRYTNEPHNYTFPDFNKWRGKKVLEIGCGIGTDAINFVRHGANYTGIDLSSESVRIAKKRFEVFGLKGELFEANAEDLEFIFDPSEKFDLIYSFGVIHHAPRPERIVHSLPKMLNHGGEVRVMLYAKNSWKNIMINAGLDQPEAQTGCPQALTYTKEEIRELFYQFPYIHIEQDFIFPWVVENYIKYEYVKQPWFEAMPNNMFRVLEKSLGWHMLITAKM